jgi:ATP-dependent Clp protease ATP-binding subunit ClpA
MGHIVDKFLKELGDQLAAKNVVLEVKADARALLAEKGYDPDNGARPLGRVIQEEVKRPLSDELLFGKLEHGGKVTIDRDGSKLSFTFASAE